MSQSFRALGVSDPVTTRGRSFHRAAVHDPVPRPTGCLAGLDVLAKSPTGSGKTLAFAIPIVERTTPKDARPSALVLVPTRELAVQVTDDFRSLARAKGLKVASVYGGVPLRSQATEARTAHVIVATPGRLEDSHSEVSSTCRTSASLSR